MTAAEISCLSRLARIAASAILQGVHKVFELVLQNRKRKIIICVTQNQYESKEELCKIFLSVDILEIR